MVCKTPKLLRLRMGRKSISVTLTLILLNRGFLLMSNKFLKERSLKMVDSKYSVREKIGQDLSRANSNLADYQKIKWKESSNTGRNTASTWSSICKPDHPRYSKFMIR